MFYIFHELFDFFGAHFLAKLAYGRPLYILYGKIVFVFDKRQCIRVCPTSFFQLIQQELLGLMNFIIIPLRKKKLTIYCYAFSLFDVYSFKLKEIYSKVILFTIRSTVLKAYFSIRSLSADCCIFFFFFYNLKSFL